MNRRFLMVFLLCAIFLLVFGSNLNAQDEPVETEPVAPPPPAYLDKAKALADSWMTTTPSQTSGQSAQSRHVGPRNTRPLSDVRMSDADFEGVVEPDSIVSMKEVVRKVVVYDREAIKYLYHQSAFMLSELDEIEFMEIYDFNSAGFADGSIIKANPSGESYILEGLSEDFIEMAATWTQKAHLQHESTSFYNPNFPLLMDGMRPPEDHGWEAPKAHLVGTENERKALEAISVSVDDAITKQYGRSPMNLFFSRSDSTTLVEIWDFEPDSLRFNYLMDGNGIPRNDIMTIAVRDSFIKSYKSYVDVMVIKHDRRDTVISPPPSRSRRR